MNRERSALATASNGQFKRWLILNVWLLALVGLLSLSYPVEELSRRVGDAYFRVRGSQGPSPDVALVLIDDASLNAYGRWPWKRSLLARVVRIASAARPKALALDILLSEAEDKSDDVELARAIQAAGNVILIAKISSSPNGKLWADPLPLFAENAAAIGHAQASLGPDSICRSVPVRELSLDGPRWAFALEIARAYRGTTLSDSGGELRLGGTAIPTIGQMRRGRLSDVQVESPRLLPIDYRGQTTAEKSPPPFTIISVKDLLDGHGSDALRAKAVLIGFGSTEISDRLPTPVSENVPMPGVEIHANLADALLSGRTLRPLSPAAQILLVLGLAFSSTWMVLRWPGWRGITLLFALLMGCLAAGYLLFAKAHLLIDTGPLLCAGVLAGPMAQVQNLVMADRQVTERLRELQRILHREASPARSGLSSALRAEQAPSSGNLHWKIRLLSQLQTELSSLYGFDETLLESMQEGLAVFSEDGNLVFHNPRWLNFCERQGWTSPCTLQDFLAAIEDPAWRNLQESLAEPGSVLNAEVRVRDGLWQLRAVKLPPSGPRQSSGLILMVATDQTARLERDRTRAEALGFVTHELRTPLVSIQGFAEYLLRYPNKAENSEAAATIFRETGRLVAMINTYLDMLRLETGAHSLKQEDFAVREMVIQVRRVVQPSAEAADVTILAEIAPQVTSLRGDPNLLAGALLNLMSNAVKFSPRGGKVTLRVLSKKDQVVFEVRNHGPLIPAGELKRIFEPFYRGQSQERTVPGWGLGLAFVKRIAEQHSGQVEVSSDSSAGNCFQLCLPASPVVLSEVHT